MRKNAGRRGKNAGEERRTHLIQKINKLRLADAPPQLPRRRHPRQDRLDLLGSFRADYRYAGYCRWGVSISCEGDCEETRDYAVGVGCILNPVCADYRTWDVGYMR